MKSCDFKTSEASTKAWYRTNGIIDKYLNILDLNKFRKETTRLSNVAKKRYNVDGRLFLEDGDSNRAIPNSNMFGQIDKAKGINYGQEERIEGEKESIDVFERKVNLLKENMNVEVIIDDTVESSRVLASSDHRTKEAGKPVILINPNKIFSTTAIHEFAHIFIDAVPKGLDNKRIKDALSSLENTTLWNQVKEAYPELSEDMLKKEVLATAMGLEGIDIWNSKEDASKASAFESFKTWLNNFLGRIFGINESDVRVLVNEMIGAKVEYDLLSNLSDIAQEERFISEDSVYEDKSKLDKLTQKIYTKIANIYELYRPTSKEKRSKEASAKKEALIKGEKTNFQKLSELKESLEEFSNKNSVAGIVKYISWSRGQIKSMDSRISRLKEKKQLDASIIQDIKAYNSAMGLVTDVQRVIIDMHSKGELSDSKKKLFINAIKDLISSTEKINDELLTAQREIYAKVMVDNSNQHETEYYNFYEKEYDKISPSENKIPWIRKMMEDNKEEIRDKAYNYYLELAENSIKDIDSLSAIFINEKNLNSTEIQVISKILEHADLNSSKFMLSKAQKFKSDFDKFSENNPGMNTEKKYEKFIETDSDGNYFLTSEFSPEFYREFLELSKTANDSDLYSEKYKDIVNDDTTYTIGKYKKKFNVSTYFKVEGEFLTYKVGKEKKILPIKEAIAVSELNYWRENNTEEVNIGGIYQKKPINKWRSDKFDKLTQEEREDLRTLKEYAREADKLYRGNHSLLKKKYNSEWIALPGVTRSTMERLVEGHLGSAIYDRFTDMFKRKEDEFDIAESSPETKAFRKVFADINNKEKLNVPIPYRARLKGTDQSLDLHTIFFMNLEAAKNYSEKSIIEPQLLTIVDVMGNRLVPDYVGTSNLLKIHGFSKKGEEIALHKSKEQLPNDLKKTLDMLENRLYGIKEKDAGEIAGVNIQKATSTYLKYAGSVALIGNYLNSIINATSGTVSNVIEAIGGETYTMKNWASAKEKYWRDSKGIINDIGANIETSRTNLMMNTFNVMGASSALKHNFENESKFTSLLSFDSLRVLDQGGEHMMQAQTMYAILDSIKVINKDGEFVDSKGKVTTKDKAASLDDVIKFDKTSNGIEMTLPDFVEGTTFSPTGGKEKILIETKGLIKKKIIDLYGVYDSNLKSAAQREWWGKLMFFLRKWIESSTMRRWRGVSHVMKNSEDLREVDKFYSEDLKQYQEGYYITAMRFLFKTIIPAIKNGQLDLIKLQGQKLSKHELANIRRVGAEVGMLGLTLLAYAAMGGFDDEADEETLVARYLLRREISEMSFYMNPTETIKILSTPTATINLFERNLKLFNQLFSPFDEYEQGPNKDRNKLIVKARKSTPFIAAFAEKDLEASMRFLDNN